MPRPKLILTEEQIEERKEKHRQRQRDYAREFMRRKYALERQNADDPEVAAQVQKRKEAALKRYYAIIKPGVALAKALQAQGIAIQPLLAS